MVDVRACSPADAPAAAKLTTAAAFQAENLIERTCDLS